MTADNPAFSAALLTCWNRLGIPAELIAERGLPCFAEPAELLIAETGADGREHQLTPAAARAWQRMKRAARDDAIDIHIVSAYRSIDRQTEIVARKLDAGQTLAEILAVSAPPGCSEHHTGRAVDIGTPQAAALEANFAQTPAWHWLRASAGSFGFVLSYPEGNRWGYSYEPWHWCFHAQAA